MMTLQQAYGLRAARWNSKPAPSQVHGQGYFAKRAIVKGEAIKRSEGSRGYNHGCAPNIGNGPAWDCVALRDIAKGEELLLDYARDSGEWREPQKFPGTGCRCPVCGASS
jgi:SET domain-containing protein